QSAGLRVKRSPPPIVSIAGTNTRMTADVVEPVVKTRSAGELTATGSVVPFCRRAGTLSAQPISGNAAEQHLRIKAADLHIDTSPTVRTQKLPRILAISWFRSGRDLADFSNCNRVASSGAVGPI